VSSNGFRFTAVTLQLLSLQSSDLDYVMNRTSHIFSPKQIKEIKYVTAKQKSQNTSFKISSQNAEGWSSRSLTIMVEVMMVEASVIT